MKGLQNCEVPNCIPTPTTCQFWDGGDLPFLGICNGDPLNNLLSEVVGKLESLAGENLSGFDLDALLGLCNTKAPQELTLINILNVIKANQVCFKDYLDNLSEQIAEALNTSKINVNLKCYQEFDNQGNALSITRDQLDQLVINKLCAIDDSIDTLNGKITNLQEQIDTIEKNTTVDELSFATCVDAGVKPTSSQVIAIADAHCELETATGDAADIAAAMAKVPSNWNTKYSGEAGWNASPSNWAELFGNVLIVMNKHGLNLDHINENCCAASCDDLKLGFSAVFNDDNDGIIIKFSFGAGTVIPAGFTDQGSTGTITDINGNVETFNPVIANNYEIEVPISGLDIHHDLTINISAKLGTSSLTCEKCLGKTVKPAACAYCEIEATGDAGAYAIITYED